MYRFKRVITIVTVSVCALALVFANTRQTDALTPAEAVVSTEWLAAHLNDPKVRIIEVSVEPGLFERGHIPGAVNFVWHTDLVNTVVRDIVPQEKFQELARAAGINDDSTIVIYGDRNNWFAAWGAWIFSM